ncbi:hypothetical protein ACFOLJ_02835 [Rugamonas sp. CCM 8940]|uniref:hypothetical protein n=1 Tax=Rugamonas sp. CCM 8940 TaxID=2765359 RepID=UPI0018F42365|nr:hypothetical protein [Rugamonas sp. CCM 8940]MBJ7311877.1 hypothetical protein [Rugamonas sp. CCM 8940]
MATFIGKKPSTEAQFAGPRGTGIDAASGRVAQPCRPVMVVVDMAFAADHPVAAGAGLAPGFTAELLKMLANLARR